MDIKNVSNIRYALHFLLSKIAVNKYSGVNALALNSLNNTSVMYDKIPPSSSVTCFFLHFFIFFVYIQNIKKKNIFCQYNFNIVYICFFYRFYVSLSGKITI